MEVYAEQKTSWFGNAWQGVKNSVVGKAVGKIGGFVGNKIKHKWKQAKKFVADIFTADWWKENWWKVLIGFVVALGLALTAQFSLPLLGISVGSVALLYFIEGAIVGGGWWLYQLISRWVVNKKIDFSIGDVGELFLSIGTSTFACWLLGPLLGPATVIGDEIAGFTVGQILKKIGMSVLAGTREIGLLLMSIKDVADEEQLLVMQSQNVSEIAAENSQSIKKNLSESDQVIIKHLRQSVAECDQLKEDLEKMKYQSPYPVDKVENILPKEELTITIENNTEALNNFGHFSNSNNNNQDDEKAAFLHSPPENRKCIII